MGVPPGVAPPPGNPRFPLLDAVRALAALSVIGFHVGLATDALGHGVLGLLLRGLQLRFELFFVMSGFLLYRPFVAARAAARRPRPVRRYVRARLLRLLPAYWLALTLLALWPGLKGLRPSTIPVYYLFGQTYAHGTIFGGIVPAWSLCVEVAFYAGLPLYAVLLRRLPAPAGGRALVRQEALPLAGLVLVTVVVRALAGGDPSVVYSVLAWLDAYALGMGLAVVSVAVSRSGFEPAPVRFAAGRPWTCWLLAAVPFALGATLDAAGRSPLAVHVLYELTALVFLLPAVFGDDRGGMPRRLLSWRPLAALGTISYGFYLWHWNVLWYLHAHGGDTWLPGSGYLSLLVASVAVTTAIAGASYLLVERPLLRRKLSSMRRAEPVPDAAPVAAL